MHEFDMVISVNGTLLLSYMCTMDAFYDMQGTQSCLCIAADTPSSQKAQQLCSKKQ